MNHPCQMLRWSEVTTMVEPCGGKILAASASNWASMADEDLLDTIAQNPDQWRRFVEHEITASREPGVLDGGSHLLFAARQVP